MVKGASVSEGSLKAVTELLEKGKTELRIKVHRFIDKIKSSHKRRDGIAQLQSEFAVLKLRFNSILDQLDIFADVMSQRAEHDVGIWLSGLDVLAEDGMVNIKKIAPLPSLMVYLDRGHGAAIRRAKTRLPGGDVNPVAVIQIPRERMVGSGIAASLIHEVGHQVASLLDLVPTLKVELLRKQGERNSTIAWKYFDRWISEIVCDVWSVGNLGVAATLGLMGVVTLPNYFQFRLDLYDPHPAPYIRVQLSCAFGRKIYPHLQWESLWQMWKGFYPLEGLKNETVTILTDMEKEMAAFVELVLRHSTKEMKGQQLITLFPLRERSPGSLKHLFQLWKTRKASLNDMPPTLVFALLGQAKFDLVMGAAEENYVLTKQLEHWAYTRN